MHFYNSLSVQIRFIDRLKMNVATYKNKWAMGLILFFTLLVAALWMFRNEYFSLLSCSLSTVMLISSYCLIKVKTELKLDKMNLFISKCSLWNFSTTYKVPLKEITKIIITKTQQRNPRASLEISIAYIFTVNNRYIKIFDSDWVKREKVIDEAMKIAKIVDVETEVIDDAIVLKDQIIKIKP